MRNTGTAQGYGLNRVITERSTISCGCSQSKRRILTRAQNNFVNTAAGRRRYVEPGSVHGRHQLFSDIGHGVAGDRCVRHILIIKGQRVAIARFNVAEQTNRFEGGAGDIR